MSEWTFFEDWLNFESFQQATEVLPVKGIVTMEIWNKVLSTANQHNFKALKLLQHKT